MPKELNKGFQFPDVKKRITGLEVIRPDTSNLLEILVDFCQRYGWLPQVDDLTEVVSLNRSERNDGLNWYFEEAVNLEYVEDFPGVHSLVGVESNGADSKWGDELPKNHLHGQVKVYNSYSGDNIWPMGTLALYLLFEKEDKLVVNEKVRLHISQDNKPFSVFLELDRMGRKKVVMTAHVGRFSGGYYDVYTDGQWDNRYRRELSKMGISDRVVESFTYDSLLELGNWMRQGKISGSAYHEIQAKANKVLCRDPKR